MNHEDLLSRLLKQLEQRGLRVIRGGKPGELLLDGPSAERTPAVMEALKAFKRQLVERVWGTQPEPAPKPQAAPEPKPELCRVCGRDVSDPEDRERMVDPAFCSQGGNRQEVRDGRGVVHPVTPRCPFKPRV